MQFDDIVWGKRLGAGSFGSVFKGEWRVPEHDSGVQ